MKLFILGATGKTGAHTVDLALARGHEVTAFVRSPWKIQRTDPKLHVVPGDPLAPGPMAEALRGHDAVLSALGPSPREAFRPSTLLTECAASTVTAMVNAEVKRLAIVSAALLFPRKSLDFVFFRWFVRHHLRDLESMEAVVRATSFDWTIARPGRLSPSSNDAYRSERGALPGNGSMSFRAVATFLMDCIERGLYVSEIVGLGRG